MENKENDFMLTVDGKDYKFSDLSDDNKLLVSHIRDLEGQVEQLNYRYEQLTASKTFFSDKLVASLKEQAEQAQQAEQSSEEPTEESVAEVVEEVQEVEQSSEEPAQA